MKRVLLFVMALALSAHAQVPRPGHWAPTPLTPGNVAGLLPQINGGTGAGALTCAAGQALTSNGTANSCTSTITANAFSGVLPQANGGTGAGALTCAAGSHITSDGTAYSCSADAGGAATYYASYFRSAGAGGQNIVNSTMTVINFDTAEVDAAATVTTGAAWHFKAPRAGVYTVKAAVLLGPTTPDVTLLLLALYQNGVEARRFYYETIAGAGVRIANGTSASGASDVTCALNDLLDIRITQVNDSASTYPTNTRAPYVYVTIYGPLP